MPMHNKAGFLGVLLTLAAMSSTATVVEAKTTQADISSVPERLARIQQTLNERQSVAQQQIAAGNAEAIAFFSDFGDAPLWSDFGDAPIFGPSFGDFDDAPGWGDFGDAW